MENLDRDKHGKHLSVYEFVAKLWSNKGHTVPQFFGCFNQPSFLLKEIYSKYNICLHEPWSQKGIHDTYSKTLLEYIVQEVCRFWAVKYAEILRSKRGDGGIDKTEGTTVTDHLKYFPTKHGSNNANKIAIDANQGPLE